jgi:hypothetical protein
LTAGCDARWINLPRDIGAAQSGLSGIIGVAIGFDIAAAFRFPISIPTPTPIGLALVMLMFFSTEADIRLFIAPWLLDLSN